MTVKKKLQIIIESLRQAGRWLRNQFPRRHLLAAGIVCAALTVLTVTSPDQRTPAVTITETVPINLKHQNAAPISAEIDLKWQTESVKSGDNLSALFFRAGLSAQDVHKMTSSQDGASLGNLFPGESLRFGLDQHGTLQQLDYIKTPLEKYVFSRHGSHYSAKQHIGEPDTLTTYRQGIIEDSLFLAGKEANLPDKLIMELANIFGWDIDFVFDIRSGDSFSVLYEERFIDGEKLSDGNILAASFTNKKKTYNAVRFVDSNGVSNYYTPEGLSMRKAFLRTPLDIFRISSNFNLKRKHPIHKKIKAHRGVDYAAPRGTPVYSAGDGKVIASGYNKYNGNYVFIQHGQTYTTKYIHLHKRKVRKGQTVRQRQIIGSVGSTGYSTGNHLHYEFLVNGVHRNPRTVKLPKAEPISVSERHNFEMAVKPMLAELASQQEKTQLAYLDDK